MTDAPVNELPDLMSSFDHLTQLLSAAESAELLLAVHRSGFLAACAEPSAPATISERTGRSVAAVEALCEALAADEVLERRGEQFVISSRARMLTAPLAAPLSERLAPYHRARIAGLRALGEGDPNTYWTAAPGDRLAIADLVSPPPGTDIGTALLQSRFDLVPEVRRELEAGGCWLELGCGVAGALMTTMTFLPEMRAVGIDLSPDLIETARGRAVALGLDDRLELVVHDATTYRNPEPAEVTFWSQFFFPEPTRAAALESAALNTRDAGFFIAPIMYDDESLAAPPGSPQARQVSLDRLLFASWGVPLRTAAELVAEVEGAGFDEVRVLGALSSPFVVARVRH